MGTAWVAMIYCLQILSHIQADKLWCLRSKKLQHDYSVAPRKFPGLRYNGFHRKRFSPWNDFLWRKKKKNATKSGGRVRVLRGQVRIPKLPTPPSRMVKPTTPKVVEQFSYSKTLVKQRVTRVTLQRGKVVKKKSRTRASRKKLFLLHYNDSLLEDSIFKLQ